MRKIKRNMDKKSVDKVRQERLENANNGFKKILLAFSGGLLLITAVIFATRI